jgi:hypothetical protein
MKIAGLDDGRMTVTSVVQDESTVLVLTEVVITKATRELFAWRVVLTAAGWRLCDVVVNNVSMASIMRSQFDSVLQDAQSDIGPLLRLLQKKIPGVNVMRRSALVDRMTAVPSPLILKSTVIRERSRSPSVQRAPFDRLLLEHCEGIVASGGCRELIVQLELRFYGTCPVTHAPIPQAMRTPGRRAYSSSMMTRRCNACW